jgi:hypothetical protein
MFRIDDPPAWKRLPLRIIRGGKEPLAPSPPDHNTLWDGLTSVEGITPTLTQRAKEVKGTYRYRDMSPRDGAIPCHHVSFARECWEICIPPSSRWVYHDFIGGLTSMNLALDPVESS